MQGSDATKKEEKKGEVFLKEFLEEELEIGAVRVAPVNEAPGVMA